MKTLRDYIKGYGYVPIILIALHKAKDGTRYELVKQEGYGSLYFLKGDEVVKREYMPDDKFEKLAIEHINHKRDVSIVEQIMKQPSYIKFVKFVYDECGEEFHL